jgi:hypothetical protein
MIASKSTGRVWAFGSTLAVCMVFTAIASVVFAAQVTLTWNANTESDLAGYRIHHGTTSGSYSAHIDVHNVTSYTVTGLTEGLTYYFAATAYDASGNESGYSNEVGHTIQSSQGRLSLTPGSGLTSSGSPGGPFSPSSITYNLTNSGNSAISWTAAKGQTWVTLSRTGGTLQPNSSTTVTVSTNNNANSLSARSTPYRDTVTFTNATNAQGGGSIGVSLSVTAGGSVPSNSNSMPWLQLLLKEE